MKLNREIAQTRREIVGPTPLYPSDSGYILVSGSINGGGRVRDDERTVIMRGHLNALMDERKRLQNA